MIGDMIGRNILHLNQATMQEVIQYWLNSIMTNAPKVDQVKETFDMFEVTVIAKTPEVEND